MRGRQSRKYLQRNAFVILKRLDRDLVCKKNLSQFFVSRTVLVSDHTCLEPYLPRTILASLNYNFNQITHLTWWMQLINL